MILVVDDSKNARSAVSFVLKSKGFEVTEAADGEEALERFRERRPDLVLADALMPRKNGYELCAALKGLLTTRDIPVILLTGQADQAGGTVKRWNPELRPNEIISKPFKIQDLVARIEAHLAARPAAK
jgi:two-component system response regulator VicR